MEEKKTGTGYSFLPMLNGFVLGIATIVSAACAIECGNAFQKVCGGIALALGAVHITRFIVNKIKEKYYGN